MEKKNSNHVLTKEEREEIEKKISRNPKKIVVQSDKDEREVNSEH